MTFRRVFLPLLLFFILIAPAGAVEEIHEKNIKSFNLSAPEGLYLTGFTASDFPPNSNSCFFLDSYGDEYYLYINNTHKFGGRWTFDIKLISPNGTQTKQVRSLHPFATNYDIHLQYYYLESDTIFDVDLFVGLAPLDVTLFSSTTPSVYVEPVVGPSLISWLFDDPDYKVIAFSNVAGSSTSEFDLVMYLADREEFQKQQENAISGWAKHAVDDLFSWAWDNILSFVEKIPGIGPQFATALIIATSLISEIFFYFKLFFIEYIETTILTIEFFIFVYSMRMTRARDPIRYTMSMIKNIVHNHIAVFEFIVEKSMLAVNIIMRIISAVAAAVNAIKP